MSSARRGRTDPSTGFVAQPGWRARTGRRLSLAGIGAAVALVASGVVAPSALASSAGSFVALVNGARAASGMRAYAVESDLTAVAQGQAVRMAAAQQLFHNPNLATQVHNWRYVGENVGYGPDVNTLMSAFMHSPEHRANILDHDYTQIGVGEVTVNGTLWVSMVFRDPMSSGTTYRPTRPATTHTTSHVTSHHATGAPRAAVARGRGRAPRRVAAAPAVTVPGGLVCSAAPTVLARVKNLGLLSDTDRTVLLVEQAQFLLKGFQCGARLPMTGVFDSATLHAVAQGR